jgi:hypothetical protein
MASSKRFDLRVVWLVMSRQLKTQLEFWLLLVDYNQKSRSISDWLYQGYLFIFAIIWGLAMLTLLADFSGQVLVAIPFTSYESTALAIGSIAFILFFLLELFSASRRSPFVFSEADAHLICQTPVDRRIVAIVWFFRAWLFRSLIIYPASIVLGYALLEAQFTGELSISHLPIYMLAGFRMLVIAIPVHLALHTLAWAAGAWRLHGNRDLPALHWSAPILAILLLTGCVLSTFGYEVDVQTWLFPLVFPLQAGLGIVSFLPGLSLAISWAALGGLLLWISSGKISLARASQETRIQEALQAAVWTMSFDLEREIKQRQRLGAGRKPSRLPIKPGLHALLWRNCVHSLRSFRLRQIFTWLWIFGLTLGVLLVDDLWMRILITGFWLFTLGNKAVHYPKMDLSKWWLMRQLPFPSNNIVLVDIALPLAGIGLAGSVALAVAFFIGLEIHPILPWLFLPGIIGVTLAAAVDILLRIKGDHLLEGYPPGTSLLTILMGALVLGIPGGSGWLALSYLYFPVWSGIVIALAISLGLDYLLYRWAGKLITNIK